jgi:hypothetical protein
MFSFEPVKRREERTGLHDECPSRNLRNSIRDRHAVQGAEGERPKDQEIESSPEEIRLSSASHMPLFDR